MQRPTLIESVFYMLLLLGLLTRHGDILALTLPLAIYLCVGIYYSPKKLQMKVTRLLETKLVASEKSAIVKIYVKNLGDDLEEVLVEDIVPDGLDLVAEEHKLYSSLPTGGEIVLEYPVKGNRGSFNFDNVRITANDRLGVIQQSMLYSAPEELVFHPEIHQLKRINIRPAQTLGYAGPILSRQAGSGLDFFGVREYQSGDPRNRINWKLSERHSQNIYTNDFERERLANIVLILDARMSSEIRFGKESLFEYSSLATASLADVFLTDGNRVGLLVYGLDPKWTFPGYGRPHKKRIEQALVHAKTEESGLFENMDHLPIRRFPARSQIVIVNPLLNNDVTIFKRLKKYGFSILVISPDPIDFEKKMVIASNKSEVSEELHLATRIASLERILRMREISKMGIPIVNWRIDASLDNEIQSTMGRFLHPSHYTRLES